MPFMDRPAGGPDIVGGFWPATSVAPCRNRSGATLLKGELCMLALGAGNWEATEIATNDSNSYIPGASNDTVWNTVVAPQSNAITSPGPGTRTGGIFGVALADIADNAVGDIQFFGLIEKAYVKDAASGDGAVPGQPLGVGVATNKALTCNVSTNSLIVAFYTDAQDTTLTNKTLKRVFLTNGIGFALNGVTSVAGGAAIT